MNAIQQALKEQGLSQSKLAEITGIHYARISQIVNGKSKINKPERAKLERFFHAPIEVLLEKEAE